MDQHVGGCGDPGGLGPRVVRPRGNARHGAATPAERCRTGPPARDRTNSATVLRQALERLADGDASVPLDELRRHLSRATRNLTRARLRGGPYAAIELSPHVGALAKFLRSRRKAG